MAKTDKPLTRDSLVSMTVIDSEGHLVGKVKDVAFQVGKAGVALVVEDGAGETATIEWDEVQAAADFILLKPQTVKAEAAAAPVQAQAAPVAASQKNQPACPSCGKPLTWIPQYKRWYCYNEKKYV
jgi:sporulation protein YlmC with PRC-barrel domain